MKNDHDVPVFMLLHQIVHLGKYHAMKQTTSFDLKPNQVGILFVLECNGQLSQKELSEKIGVTPPSMTVALRKLEERGYITKEADTEDQRIVRIELSEKGKSCIAKIHSSLDGMEELVYRGMSKEERLLLHRLLIEARNNLIDYKEFQGMDLTSIMRKTQQSKKGEF